MRVVAYWLAVNLHHLRVTASGPERIGDRVWIRCPTIGCDLDYVGCAVYRVINLLNKYRGILLVPASEVPSQK